MWRHEPSYWHEIWLACPDYNLDGPEEADHCMSYDGEHLYTIGTLIELLEAGVIKHENCRLGHPCDEVDRCQGSENGRDHPAGLYRRGGMGAHGLAAGTLPEAEQPDLDDAEAAEHLRRKSDERRVGRQKKGAVLDMIGIWNKDARRQRGAPNES